jgi:hypothetical protein
MSVEKDEDLAFLIKIGQVQDEPKSKPATKKEEE